MTVEEMMEQLSKFPKTLEVVGMRRGFPMEVIVHDDLESFDFDDCEFRDQDDDDPDPNIRNVVIVEVFN